MKKFGLIVIGIIAGIIILANLGSLLGLAISGLIVYLGASNYVKANSTWTKILWASIGIIGLLTAAANVPAFLGLIAILAIWFVIRKWNDKPVIVQEESNDPFVNFEKQWSELNK